MLQVLCLSSLVGLALSACTLPPAPTGVTYPTQSFTQATQPDGKIAFKCPTNFFPFGNFGPGGPLLFEINQPQYMCDPNTGKFFATGSMETLLTTMICAEAQVFTMCSFLRRPDWLLYSVPEGVKTIKCPTGYKLELHEGEEIDSLRCSGGVMTALLLNGTNAVVGKPDIACVAGNPYTTTTVATTTTVKPDSPATASQLWNVNYYYNYGIGVHAFCADIACINAIQSNGIGYDMNNGWGLLGRAVSESAIDSVRASCPTGSQMLRNLGFTKSGNKYLHNLSGGGLKQGWVSISKGACGSSVTIKRWKSRYTDDMMYGVDMEWNDWYQGMVQDGGQAQFYMWA